MKCHISSSQQGPVLAPPSTKVTPLRQNWRLAAYFILSMGCFHSPFCTPTKILQIYTGCLSRQLAWIHWMTSVQRSNPFPYTVLPLNLGPGPKAIHLLQLVPPICCFSFPWHIHFADHCLDLYNVSQDKQGLYKPFRDEKSITTTESTLVTLAWNVFTLQCNIFLPILIVLCTRFCSCVCVNFRPSNEILVSVHVYNTGPNQFVSL